MSVASADAVRLPTGVGKQKPGLIVDGQQRATALSQLDPSRKLPVVVVAFQSAAPKTQREQFVLVNKTRPLPRDLLNELLANVEVVLPKTMRSRQVAAKVLEVLPRKGIPTRPNRGRVT